MTRTVPIPGRLSLSVIGLLIFVLLVPSGHAAAHWGFTGILEGRILDKGTGEPLPGVNVVLVGTLLGAVTDMEGNYYIQNIRAGEYEVRFTILGYNPVHMKKVTILPDLRTRVDLELEEAPLEVDAIEIIAEKPLIQKDQPSTSFSIGELKIEKLPISKFQDVLGLQPGTTFEGNVRGGKTTEVVYYVDGLPVQDVIGGGLGTSLPRSSISGVTVYTGGFEAEYGNALSGVVNVVTKTGGDKHNVSVRVERDNWIPETWNKQHDRHNELEVTASGPIRKGLLSYLSATTLTASDTRWWQDLGREFASPISADLSGFTKLELVPSAELRIGVQGIYALRRWRDYEYSWRFNLAGLPARRRDSYRGALTVTHTLSPTTFYTASLSRYSLTSSIGSGPKESLTLEPYEYDFYLRYVVNGDRNWWARSTQKLNTVKVDLTTSIDRMHLVKFGVELNQYEIFSDLVKFEPQRTYFGKPLVTDPLLNYSNTYEYSPRSGSLYLQDKIEFERDGSNLSVGLRWDFMDPRAQRPLVEFIPVQNNEFEQQVVGLAPASFKHQFSPRISFGAPFGPNGYFYTNLGHYFQFPLFDHLYSGTSPSQLFAGSRNVLTGNPDLEPERTIAWEIGVKYALDQKHLASFTYFKKTSRNQIDSKTLVPFDSKAAGDFGFAQYVNSAEARSTGFEIVVSRERDDLVAGSLSYTFMTAEGISEYVDQSINYAQWGFPLVAAPYPLSWDQRHTLKVDADILLPGRVRSNLIVLYNSPRPYTYYPTRDGFTPSNPNADFLPNNRRMEHVVFVNLKLSRMFDVDGTTITLYADARNIINRANVRWIDSNGQVGGELGDPGAYYDPRRLRIGIRIDL